MPFIPLYDGNPLRHVGGAWISWSLIAVNFAVFFTTTGDADALQSSAIRFGLIPGVFNDVYSLPPEYQTVPDALTLLTYAFLHGDIWHLLGNMVFLWVFADNVEDALGHLRFLLFYCLSAVGAGYAHVLATPASDAPVIGASGAVAGVVAAYVLLHPFAKVWILAVGRIPLRLASLWVIGFWALYQVYEVSTAADGETAWWTHIGGFVVGAGLVLILRRRGVPLFGRLPARPDTQSKRVDDSATGGIGSAPQKTEGPQG